MSFAGIEIGGTKLQIVRGDESGRIVARRRERVDLSRGGEGIRTQIQTALGALAGGTPFAGIGVGFGGPVDWQTGKIRTSHQVEGWDGFELTPWLREVSGCDAVAVDNDANVGALGECSARAERPTKGPLMYVTLGSGVGAGLCVDGRIYHGANPGECELGHIRLDRSGTTVESRCSGWAIDRRIREASRNNPASLLSRALSAEAGGEARALPEALSQRDSDALRIFGELSDDLAFALSHAIHLMHPATIVIGGGLSLLGEPLRQAVAERLPHYLMQAFQPGPAVELALLGEDAVPIGALCLARQAQVRP